MIFRNDDVSHSTDLQQLKDVQALFDKYEVQHTIALICKDIQKSPELIKFINAHNIDVQVHAWGHTDFTKLTGEEIRVQFKKSIACIKKHFKKTPTVFYPPWNRSNELVETVAAEFGLTVSDKKISLSQYLRGATRDVINFHSWSDECKDLEPALKKYTSL
jgi:peptidoglycan/xylan/chitin deacetylase (PgdA/CDA1 family)